MCRSGNLVIAALIAAAFIPEPVCARYAVPPANRVTVNFNPDWKYLQGDTPGAEAAAYSDASWTSVALPHSTQWVTPDDDAEYLGICWYRKHFIVADTYTDRKIFIEFEGAMQWAQVWVNGVSKITHEGGYMGFTVDITDQVIFGAADNVIAVKLDTRPNASWAPGKAEVDFRYYGGLYRDVRMRITDRLHVTDALFANTVAGGGIFVTYPAVSASSATVSIKTHVINENATVKSCTVLSELVDSAGTVAGSATMTATIAAGADTTTVQTITLSNPRLWSHLTPNLYTLHTTAKDEAMSVDHCTTPIGIRRIAWTRSNGLQINGTNYKLQGTNEHQDIFGLGNAIPNRAIFYEVKTIKEAGFDFIRCAHYPHDPAFYDACDCLGIVVMNCLTGWHNFPNTTAFNNNTFKEAREMVRRDRNHPCVVVWETSLNESSYDNAWATTINAAAHAEYPGDQMFTNGFRLTVFDVFSDAAAHTSLYNEAARPVIVSEYGDWEYGGLSSTSRVKRESDDASLVRQAVNHQHRMNINRTYSWFGLDALWSFGDNGSAYLKGPFFGGITDMYRLKKFSYYFFMSQRDATASIPGVLTGPMVYIANTWRTGSPGTVKIFSNCDSVALYRNGALVGTRGPDNDTMTGNLRHPPFTFSVASFSSGSLQASGIIGGTVRASHTRTTPGAAAVLALRPISSDPLGTEIGEDARLLWIEIVDANMTVVPTATHSVTLSISGPGIIMGPSTVTVKGGQLATWVRPDGLDGPITLTASATGLAPGALSLRSATGIVQNTARKFTRTAASGAFKALGNRIVLPKEFKGGMYQVSVFDIAGRLVHYGKTKNRCVILGGEKYLGARVYCVKIQGLKE